MKKIFTSLAIAAALVGCNSQGSHQGGNASADNSKADAQLQQPVTVVKNFDLKLVNQNTESAGKCGDKFSLLLSRVSQPAYQLQNVRADISIDGKIVATLQGGDSTFVLDTKDMRCGKLPISVKISADGVQDEYIAKSLELYSDITPKTLGYKVLKTFNHDRFAYTQGLVIEGDHFYESTGLQRKSSLRKVSIASGEVLQSVPLEDEYFGEGLAMVGERLYQLTWRSHKAFAYDKKTLGRIQEFYLPTEGWGLTAVSPDTLALTDGTCNLYMVEPGGLATVKTLQVYDNAGPVALLNESELYHGHLLVNIYQSNLIAEVDYHTGKVINYIDLSGLLPDNLRDDNTDVLNGIAYDQAKDALYVTGKNWPKLYLIKIK